MEEAHGMIISDLMGILGMYTGVEILAKKNQQAIEMTEQDMTAGLEPERLLNNYVNR